jgi:hypothetical protein
MTQMISGLFGGGATKTAEKAQRDAAEQRRIDQARQLNTLNTETQRTALSRRNPRGRRLSADATVSNLPQTAA